MTISKEQIAAATTVLFEHGITIDELTLKRVLEASEQAAWQPIETAPKDGKPIWVFAMGDKRQGIVCWIHDRHYGIRQGYWEGVSMCTSEPTHWRYVDVPTDHSADNLEKVDRIVNINESV